MKRAALLLLASCGRLAFDPQPDAAAAFDPAACPSSYALTLPGSDHRYRLTTSLTPWVEAQATCVADQVSPAAFTHLVVIGGDSERLDVTTMFAVNEPWVGLTDRRTEGLFLPVTIEDVRGYPVVGTSAWAPGEPNNEGSEHCAQLVPAGTFNDAVCTFAEMFICECDGFAVAPSQY